MELYFQYDKKKPAPKSTNEIKLRPNTEQTVFLFVKNTSPISNIKDLTVKLYKIGSDGQPGATLQQTQIGTLEKGKFEAISFGKEEEEKKDEKKEVKAELSLDGPPFELQVVFEQADYAPKTVLLPVTIMEPREYILAKNPQYFDGPKTFSVEVEENQKDLVGPPCSIQLDLQPKVIPGYIPVKTQGIYKQVLLPDQKRTASLKAENLQFEDNDPPKYGRFYLTIDDYKRAYIFNNAFSTKTDIQELGTVGEPPRVRLVVPRYAIPGEKFPVQLEVDNPPNIPPRKAMDEPRPKPIKIELEIDYEGLGQNFAPFRVLRGPRQQQVFLNPTAPGGGILFQSVVKDWTVNLDTTDLFGTKALRATMQKYDREEKKYESELLFNEQQDDKQKIEVFDKGAVNSPFAPLGYTGLSQEGTRAASVVATFTLDSTKPQISWLTQGLKETESNLFEGKLKRGKAFEFAAEVNELAPESPLKEVIFFIGKPTPKGKLPEGTVPVPGNRKGDAKGEIPNPSVWLAQLPIDTTKPGEFEVTVQATNQAGLSDMKTIKLILVDAPKKEKENGDEKKGAKIIGTVVVGSLPQSGLQVILSDEDGKVKGATKTKSKPPGQFVFKNVKPGAYQISASNPALKLQGQVLVEVPEGVKKVKDVKVELKR